MKRISSINYKEFEKIFLKMFDYEQYADGRKGFDYNESFKRLIKKTYDYFINEEQEYDGKLEKWLQVFYKDNAKGKNQIWLKKPNKVE